MRRQPSEESRTTVYTDYAARAEIYWIYWKKYECTKILILSDSQGKFKAIASSQARFKLVLEINS